jgi:glyoxylase-like metal-dependent hydrolase (beta-lactamase superfamily II)
MLHKLCANSTRWDALRKLGPHGDQESAAQQGPAGHVQGRPGNRAGIHAIASPGHTVGHTSFMIASTVKSLCFTGDIAHHTIMFRNPRLEVVFDTDAKQATESRLKMCSMLAAERIPALIFHLPWPGIGHIAKQGDGFRFLPVPMFPV